MAVEFWYFYFEATISRLTGVLLPEPERLFTYTIRWPPERYGRAKYDQSIFLMAYLPAGDPGNWFPSPFMPIYVLTVMVTFSDQLDNFGGFYRFEVPVNQMLDCDPGKRNR
jgi:hypothetical protein